MAKAPAEQEAEVYEEIATVPVGRKGRTISASLAAALEDSAKRNVGFRRIADEATIDKLRSDLNSRAVKRKYKVTTSSGVLEDGRHTLHFGAAYKAPDQAPETPAAAQ